MIKQLKLLEEFIKDMEFILQKIQIFFKMKKNNLKLMKI